MKYLKKYILYIIIGIIILIVGIYVNIDKEVESMEIVESVETEESVTEEKRQEIIEEPTIKVDIKGAIAKPGVYELKEKNRVIDLIEKSGGLLWNADTSTINLSKYLEDEMVIVIYTKEEILKIKEGNVIVEYVEKECICPELVQNNTCVEESLGDLNKNDAAIEIPIKEENSKININTATIEELMTLPGIGESKAKDIIKYRDEFSGFKSIEDIKNISGIKEASYNKLKDLIQI